MKKLFTLILCAAALVGCSYGVEEGNDTPAAKGSTITITADATRIAHNYNSEDKITYTTWSNGDAILVAVYDGDALVGTATLTNTAAGEYATFTGSLAGVTLENKDYTIEAIYPADVTASAYEKGKITIAADAAQHVMIAKQQTVTAKDNSINLAVQFMPMVSRLHVNASAIGTPTGFAMVAKDAVFAKTATINFVEGSVAVAETTTTLSVETAAADFYAYAIPTTAATSADIYAYNGDVVLYASNLATLPALTRNKTYNMTLTADKSTVKSGEVNLSDLLGDDVPDGFKGNSYWVIDHCTTSSGVVIGVHLYVDQTRNEMYIDCSRLRENDGLSTTAYNQASIFLPIADIAGEKPANATKLRVTYDATTIYSKNNNDYTAYIEWGNYTTDAAPTSTPVMGAGYKTFAMAGDTNHITTGYVTENWALTNQTVDITVDELGDAKYIGFSLYDTIATMGVRNVTIQWVK